MGLKLEYINGQTPIDEDEKEGLLIPTITTRGELDEFEQLNIEKAVQWSIKNKFKIGDIFTEDFIKTLHRKMFSDVWLWAGELRKTDKNIGVDKYRIGIELKNLIDDSKYWLEHETYLPDEIAIRFSHRIVQIHLFPNGNGRHSRLIGDIIANHVFDRPVFSWGSRDLLRKGEARSLYLDALRDADQGNYMQLIKLSRM